MTITYRADAIYMRGRTGYNKISHTGSVMQKYGGNVNHIHNTHIHIRKKND